MLLRGTTGICRSRGSDQQSGQEFDLNLGSLYSQERPPSSQVELKPNPVLQSLVALFLAAEEQAVTRAANVRAWEC